MNRYGSWAGGAAENISYGCKTGEQIIMQLFIDDGVPNRGHRTNLQNPDFQASGLATGYHKEYDFMASICYANSYTASKGAILKGVNTNDVSKLMSKKEPFEKPV